MDIRFIEPSHIVEDPDQPRKHYDEEGLKGLADSIRQHGMLQPITVTELPNVNMFRIVCGERRWRAAQMLAMDVMPCIVRDVDPEEILTQQLIENLQREDLQPVEKARAIKYVKDRLGATNREIGGRLGVSERSVGYLLDLLDLPFEISEKVVSNPNRPASGQLTEKHARFLKQLSDQPEVQSALAEKIQSEKINTEQTGKLIKAIKKNPDKIDEILQSPTDHLLDFFRGVEPELPELPDDSVPAVKAAAAERIEEFTQTLDFVRPMDTPHPQLRQILDSLTALKSIVDGLIRECKLELGE